MFNQEFMKERKKGLKAEGFRAEVVCFLVSGNVGGLRAQGFPGGVSFRRRLTYHAGTMNSMQEVPFVNTAASLASFRYLPCLH